jgi:hypothetical protein
MKKHIRDVELSRLREYANAYGARVIIKDYDLEEYGGITLDGTTRTITVNSKEHRSKTELLLTLLHEICHLKHHVLTGQELPDALLLDDEDLTLEQRAEVAKFEFDSLELMPVIAKDLNLKVPKWKILLQRDLDQWVYELFRDSGEFPSNQVKQLKRRQLTERYKPKNGKEK